MVIGQIKLNSIPKIIIRVYAGSEVVEVLSFTQKIHNNLAYPLYYIRIILKDNSEKNVNGIILLKASNTHCILQYNGESTIAQLTSAVKQSCIVSKT